MKICLDLEFRRLNKQASGLGVALSHQQKALSLNRIDYTLNWRDRYDVLHANFMGPRTYWLVKERHKKGQKNIAHIHTTPEDFAHSFTGSTAMARLMKPYFRRYLSFADAIIVPSQYTKDLLLSRYHINRPIEVVSNGVDLSAIGTIDPQAIEKFRQDYKIHNPFIFGLGLVFARKGVDDFIHVGASFPKASFLWAGRKFSKLITWHNEIDFLLKNLPSNVQFPGFIPDKWAALAVADIFLFPSHEENQGIVVLEAAAMGKAIIIRDIPVYRTYLTPGKDCLLARNLAEFSQHVKTLLADKKLRDTLGRNARDMVRHHDLAIIGQQLKKIYQSII